MTFFQLTVALETARQGSISKAAQVLGLSQPNASNYIHSIEKELGLELFRRSANGIDVTDAGFAFLEHAENIMRECDCINELKSDSPIFRLRVGHIKYTPAVEAFLQVCREQKEAERADLKCIAVTSDSGLELLTKGEIDLFVSFVPDALSATQAELRREHKLTEVHIADLSLNVNLRKDHPLALLHRKHPERFSIDLLRDYPSVGYTTLNPDGRKLINTAFDDFHSKYTIDIDDRDSRHRIVSQTDAFSVGCFVSRDYNERYGIYSIPVLESYMHLYCVMRRSTQQRRENLRYIELLKQQFDEL